MKKIISLLLSVVMAFSCFAFILGTASVAADEWVNVDMSYEDSTETHNRNPGRGRSGGGWIILGKDTPNFKTSYASSGGVVTPKFDLGQYSAGNDYTQGGSPNNKDNPGKYTGGVDKALDKKALDTLEDCFSTAEAYGIQVIPRFAYTWSDAVGCEPSEFELIETHIAQIAEVINKYKDTVISVECGILGPWGEMHSSPYNKREYERRVMAAYLDNMDPTVTLQVRAAGFIVEYHGRNTDIRFMKNLPIKANDPLYRVGMFNDGYLGTNTDYGTWSGGINLNRARGIEFLKEQNKRIPYGGEMAYCGLDEVKNWGSPIYDDTFLKELYDTHLSYLDNITTSSHTIANELNNIIFSERHDFDGMPDLKEYYGHSIQKVMLDHMGYRFVMRSAQTTGSVNPGEVIKFRGTIENTGFGNLLADMVGELILVDEEGETIAVPIDVDPQKWYTCETTEYNVSVSVPKDAASGTYDAFMRFSSLSLADSAKTTSTILFANAQPVKNSFGGNYIGTVNVTDNATGIADSYKQVYVDFTDVKDGYWGKEFITDICTLGLMGGVSAGKFSPETVATRAQFVTILYRMEGSPAVDGVSTPLTDINGWYTDAIKWAYSEGIVNGVTATKFDPNGKLNRETFATMLCRYAKSKGIDVDSVGGDLSKFTDANKVSPWALDSLKWANAKGYISGMTTTTIVPKGMATRAQMATILTRYVGDTAK